MELNKKDLEAAVADFTSAVIDRHNSISKSTMEDITSDNKDELKNAVAVIGQRNTTSLGVDEYADFFPKEVYEQNITDTIRHTRTTNQDNRTFDRVYALCKRYYKNGQSKIGEHLGFVDITGLIRQHIEGNFVPVEGQANKHTCENPNRVDDKGAFNTAMRAQRLPWNMLCNVLAGKTLTATLSKDKQFYQNFSRSGQPLEDYSERQYSVYSLK